LLLGAQLLTIGTVVWEGLGGVPDVRRIGVYAVAPVMLIVWFMAQAFYSTDAEFTTIVLLLPSIGGTIILFSPSWAAIALGILVSRSMRSRMSSQQHKRELAHRGDD